MILYNKHNIFHLYPIFNLPLSILSSKRITKYEVTRLGGEKSRKIGEF